MKRFAVKQKKHVNIEHDSDLRRRDPPWKQHRSKNTKTIQTCKQARQSPWNNNNNNNNENSNLRRRDSPWNNENKKRLTITNTHRHTITNCKEETRHDKRRRFDVRNKDSPWNTNRMQNMNNETWTLQLLMQTCIRKQTFTAAFRFQASTWQRKNATWAAQTK